MYRNAEQMAAAREMTARAFEKAPWLTLSALGNIAKLNESQVVEIRKRYGYHRDPNSPKGGMKASIHWPTFMKEAQVVRPPKIPPEAAGRLRWIAWLDDEVPATRAMDPETLLPVKVEMEKALRDLLGEMKRHGVSHVSMSEYGAYTWTRNMLTSGKLS